MLVQRTSQGRPCITHGGGVVAADAITLLSGVNFGSVEKILAAIAVIMEYSGTDAIALVDLNDVPLERVRLSDPRHAERAARTRELCEDIAASGRYGAVEDILHLKGRFVESADV